MSEPDTVQDVDIANRQARRIAIAMIVALVILVLGVKMSRGESDTTFWLGFATVFFSVGLPSAVFIAGNDALGNVKRKGDPILSDLACTYLIAFIVISAVIVLALGWYSFIATYEVAQMLATGQEQTREIRYPFALAASDVCTIASPFLTLLFSLELFQAAKSLKKKGG